MTITNKEFQDELARYPKDLPIAIAIQYNGIVGLFYDVKVTGIKSEDMAVVIINNPDVDVEYETLLNGCDDIDQNY